MEFHCTQCHCKLTVPDTKAGRKGRCPKCSETLTVPELDVAPKSPLHNMQLLDVPPSDEREVATTTERDESAAAYEQLRGSLGGRLMDPEEIPERKHAWIVDIFLYPSNLSALTMILICVGVPFLLRVLLTVFKVLTASIQIAIILWLVSLMIHWGVFLLLITYAYWYLCQCVRDSAEGQIRAVETTAMTPGLGELLGNTLKLMFAALICLAPAIVHYAQTGSPDQRIWILSGAGDFLLPAVMPIEVLGRMVGAADPLPVIGSISSMGGAFWLCWGLGNFLFPMVLLSVIMHEGFIRALNPILIARSILRTFPHYCVLAASCCLLSLSFSTVYGLILNARYWHWSYILLALAFYQLLIMAHLLGRFFFKHDAKLYWDT
jgi:hypothetical protein